MDEEVQKVESETPDLVDTNQEVPPPADPAPEAGNKTQEKVEPQDEVPEEYGEFDAGEGAVFDTKQMPEFVAMAKELRLSKEKAHKLFMSMVPAFRGRLEASKNAINESWKQASLTDQEFGGDNFKANMTVANTAFKKYVSPELAGLMKRTGLSVHPDFIRMFYRIGKQISQDTGVTGSGGAQVKRKLFPNSNLE